MMSSAIPEDRELERAVVGAVLACWLRAIDVDPDVFYFPPHARLIVAARRLAARDALHPQYEVRERTRVVMGIRGLADALSMTGSTCVAEDVALGEALATRAPAATVYDVERLRELATRRDALRDLADQYQRVLDGEPLDQVLA